MEKSRNVEIINEYIEFKIKRGGSINILFWNIYKKNLIDILCEIIIEKQIDIIAMAECENLDVKALINHLHVQGYFMKIVEIYPENRDIKVLAKDDIKISPKEENKRFSTYQIWYKNDLILLSVLHLNSGLYKEENARNIRAQQISKQIEKIEDKVYGENERKGIVIGDFNLQPYSDGIANVFSFNATMSASKAKKLYRKIDNEKCWFYFNPVWKLMGDNTLVQGSYYNNEDAQDKSIYWYAYDAVLLRPYFIDKFNWNKFQYIFETKKHSLLSGKTINKKEYSDHLPIVFEIS